MDFTVPWIVLVAASSYLVTGVAGSALASIGSASAHQPKSEVVTSPPTHCALLSASDRSPYEEDIEEAVETRADHQGDRPLLQVHAGEGATRADCSGVIYSDEGVVQSPGYEDMVRCTQWARVVRVRSGYNISFVVNCLDLDRVNQDYLTINPGVRASLDKTMPIFTGKLSSTRSLRVNTDSAFIRFSAQQVDRDFSFDMPFGFTITFKKEGEITTPPPPTTPGIVFPTAASAVHLIQVYLKGLTLEKFQEVLPTFRKIVANNTNIFCESNDINPENVATERNVIIWYMTQCPNTWVDSTTCVRLRMSVIINTGSEGKYELTRENLIKMWLLVVDDEHLAEMKLRVFFPLEDMNMMLSWVYASVGALASFVLLLVLVWKLDLSKQYNPLPNTKDKDNRNETQNTLPEDLEGPIKEFTPNKFDTGATTQGQHKVMDLPPSNKNPTTTDSQPNMGPPPSYGLPQGTGFWTQNSHFLEPDPTTAEDNSFAHINHGYDIESDLPTTSTKDWKGAEERLL